MTASRKSKKKWPTKDECMDEVLALKARDGINTKNEGGATPLYLAAYLGKVGMVEALLEAGADVNATCYIDHATALTVASKHDEVEVVRLLLAAGASTEVKSLRSVTPETFEAEDGHADRVADIWLPTGIIKRYSTYVVPLYFAAQEGSAHIVMALLLAGASVEASRPDGATPLKVALYNDKTDVAKKFLQEGRSDVSSVSFFSASAKNCFAKAQQAIANDNALAELTDTLRHDPTSFFSFMPSDLTKYVLTPMILDNPWYNNKPR